MRIAYFDCIAGISGDMALGAFIDAGADADEIRSQIASVGPVVSDELKSHGLRTDISPANDAYFVKPLISAMATALGKTPPRTAAARAP